MSGRTGLRLALGCAVTAFVVLGAGLVWGGGRQGFTMTGWLGLVGLAMGGLNLTRMLQGKAAWF